MRILDERVKGFERKFAHDEEQRFKATIRRNRLFGRWAAEKLGLSGDAVDSYVKTVVKADFGAPGDDNILRKVKQDFTAKGVDQSEHQIERTLGDMMHEAARQIEVEAAKS